MTTTASDATVSAILLSATDETVELRPPHTEYAIRLRLAEGTGLAAAPGKRVRGVIEGRALRVHANAGGGRFIEPLAGEPRIVCGSVRAVDADGRRVLVHAVVPMWLGCPEDQDLEELAAAQAAGSLVNCYVESGLTFTPETARG